MAPRSSSRRRDCASCSRLLVVYANTVVSTDRLIDVMWPDDGEAHALRTLRTNVWRLRNLLGPGADATLLTRQGGYVLALSADDHDAERFETLAADGSAALTSGDASLALGSLDAALALWRGRAFEGYETEDWARPAAVRLDDIGSAPRSIVSKHSCCWGAPTMRSPRQPESCRSTRCENEPAPCTCGRSIAANARPRRCGPTPSSVRRSPRNSASNHRRSCGNSSGRSSTTIWHRLVGSPPSPLPADTSCPRPLRPRR